MKRWTIEFTCEPEDVIKVTPLIQQIFELSRELNSERIWKETLTSE